MRRVWFCGRGLALTRCDEALFVDDARVPAPAGVPATDFAGLLREAAAHEVSAAVCIGSPGSRHEVAARLEGAGIGLATLVSVEARVSRRALVGAGCIVNGFSSIEPDVELGANTLALDAPVSRGSVVGRGCVLDSRCVLSRGCRAGERALIGVGATVGEGVLVGAGAVVATGAVALEDVPEGAVVVGNPAVVVCDGA